MNSSIFAIGWSSCTITMDRCDTRAELVDREEDRKAARLPLNFGSMNVIVDLCIVPIGVGTSVSAYVAACERVLKDAGLNIMLHAYGTNIEGEWEAVFDAIRKCHEVVHEMGAPRISTTIKLGTRTDRHQTMEDKIRSVEEKLRAR